jgi:hypothetical protein
MIEGLKVKMPGTVVAALAQTRADYHNAKVQHYNDAKASVHIAVGTNARGSYDPEGQLEAKSQEHQGQAQYFAIMAEHVVRSEDYLLDKNELAHLLGSTRY